MTTEKMIIMFFVILLIIIGLHGCINKICPDTTTLEMGETSNGKDKNTKSIKQSFKWGKKKCNES
jgi:hypothetical protein